MDYEKAPESQGEVKNWDIAPERDPRKVGEKAIFSESTPENDLLQKAPEIEIVPVTPTNNVETATPELFSDAEIYPSGKDISGATLEAMHTIESTFPSNPNVAYKNFQRARKTYVEKDENNPSFPNYQLKFYRGAA